MQIDMVAVDKRGIEMRDNESGHGPNRSPRPGPLRYGAVKICDSMNQIVGSCSSWRSANIRHSRSDIGHG